jgi:ABC-type Mn2+/Zn2+ transport system ATPase subunit
MTTPLLDVRGIHAGHGAAEVLFGIDLAVAPGEIVGVLGRNGMGKTTLVRTIMGLLRPRAGTIALAGRDITGRAPNLIARAGVGLVPEGRQVFPQPQRRRAPRCVPARVAPRRVRLDAGARARALSRRWRRGARTAATSCRVASSRCSRSAAPW